MAGTSSLREQCSTILPVLDQGTLQGGTVPGGNTCCSAVFRCSPVSSLAVKDGAICLEQLAKALGDPMVYAVYSQSLSYTDGISDNIPAIVRLMEEENQKRSKEVFLNLSFKEKHGKALKPLSRNH